MATVRKKRELLSVEAKVKVIREKETGKNKSDVCREFSIVNFAI
jgi:transposase-like protein